MLGNERCYDLSLSGCSVLAHLCRLLVPVGSWSPSDLSSLDFCRSPNARICIDLEQRVETHQNGKGAKYTRSRLPVTLVFHEQHRSKGDALRREADVKKWSKQRKERLVSMASDV